MVFEPNDILMGLCGGLLIGVAAALLLLLNGRVAGISGIATGLFTEKDGRRRNECQAFIAGLILAPGLYALYVDDVDIVITGNPWVLVAAGLLVGIGTRIANGCTSGHGVCGISRLSPRSLAATTVFMTLAAIVAVTVGALFPDIRP